MVFYNFNFNKFPRIEITFEGEIKDDDLEIFF